MKAGRFAAFLLILSWCALVLFCPPLEGTLKYRKDTGKECIFCHSGIPEKGDEDSQLNEDGQKFKENDYRLTKEQEERDEPQQESQSSLSLISASAEKSSAITPSDRNKP
jgi:hypothetical protein